MIRKLHIRIPVAARLKLGAATVFVVTDTAKSTACREADTSRLRAQLNSVWKRRKVFRISAPELKRSLA
jgi:hypothetical protein